jgi:hypothetical protein
MSSGESFPSGAAPVAPKDAAFNRRLTLLVVASFLMFAAVFALRVGISTTSYDATDSAGRPMGFNDPLGVEHYLIILQHFRPAEFLKPEHAYEWLLLAMQAAGAWLLLSRARIPVRFTRCFFAAQAAFFPLGLLFCWMPPLFFVGLFTASMDREGFTDFPFVATMGMLAHSTWVVACVIIVFALRGPGLGPSKVWRALRESVRGGGRVFVQALR